MDPLYDKDGSLLNLYELFAIPADADTTRIKSAFTALIKLYHPDRTGVCSGEIMEKISLIVRGYHILRDRTLRNEYDRLLEKSVVEKAPPLPPGTIPASRIRYSISLNTLIEKNFLPKGMKRKDIIKNFTHDVEILLTQDDIARGCRALVQIPARMTCPLCAGRDTLCPACHGTGRMGLTSTVEITIPPGIRPGAVIDFDLGNLRPDKHTSYRIRTLRVRLDLIDATHT